MMKQAGWLVVLALLVGACAPDLTVTTTQPHSTTSTGGTVPATTGLTVSSTPLTASTTAPDRVVGLFASALVEFDSCDAFLGHVKAEALERVGPYGLDGGPRLFIEEDVAVKMMEESAASAVADSAASAPQAGLDYSTTNVQEVGVDEPDIVKTDGNRILALAHGILHYIDVSSGSPDLVSSLDLWSWEAQQGNEESLSPFYGSQMFLGPDTALLMAAGYGPGGDLTQVVQVDLSDPGDLTVTSTLTVEGRFVSARLVGERVSLVLTSRPHERLQFVYPGSRSAEARAEMANRMTIGESTLEDWAPGYVLEGAGGVSQGLFIDCGSSYAPDEFSGFDFVSVLSFDLAGQIGTEEVSTVMSGGDTVYASSTNLYVATQRRADWAALDEQAAIEEAETTSTHIHQFDISGPGGAEYLASGSVDGFLLNQFAMSEHDGHLRVASTNDPSWGWWSREDQPSVSRVDVLARDGRQLRVVGSVGDLGEGERIFAVRFIGEIGYIVTFRQTDPLYTIDLSDPENPRVVGELKILGYSAYLHPIGEGLLLGIGQDADEQGRTRGAQVSVFDVSDLANPIRTHRFTVEDSYSDVEWDHRAFLYWAPKNMAVMPVAWWKYDDQSDYWDYFAGAFVLSVGAGGIRQLAALEHEFEAPGVPEDELRFLSPWPILRSLVVGDTLFTLSGGGLQGSDLDTLETTSWIGFPIPDYGTSEPITY
ncbi:MAG: beta-propeller domain-containing protein [Acidimicrobiia bacterium]|nr:beta-propeller domain-containing protein [Acidimicrobiia bacterium]